VAVATAPTAERILDVATQAFGTRGFEATSLDDLAADLGLTKQTILYWYPSKKRVLDAAVERGVAELVAALEPVLASAPAGLGRVDAVMRTVFRFAVRRPALLGLVREVSRLGPRATAELRTQLAPLVARAHGFLEAEMAVGSIRRADPGNVLLFAYSMVIGVATDLETQRALGIEQSVSSLARLRRELFEFVRAGLTR